MIREHGILFQDEMVRAILDGRKDVTRRTSDVWAKRSPGDRLWVRECWGVFDDPNGEPRLCFRADGATRTSRDRTESERFADAERPGWRPSIHMPRWASRMTLEIVSLTKEQALGEYRIPLPGITDAEARREGVADRAAYLDLWRAINGDDFGGVVWRVEFRVLAP